MATEGSIEGMITEGNSDQQSEIRTSFNTDNFVPILVPEEEPHAITKEIGINKPTPFDGDRRKVETFVQECRVYLQVNKRIYSTDEAKIAFFLSFMNDKEALTWKQTFLRSITNADGEMKFPTIKEFVGYLNNYFRPTNQTQNAAHQLALLRQGNKTAEEIITQFRLLISLAGYSSETQSDHLHLIEKLQRTLNPSLVKKIMLMDNPPTTLPEWIEKAILVDGNYRMTMDVLGRLKEGKSKGDGRAGNSGKSNHYGTDYFKTRKSKEERDPNAMDIDAMSMEKRTALMRKGACFICEETGHLARDHKEREKKKENPRGTTSFPPKKKSINEIHALLQTLSGDETKELMALQSMEEEKNNDSDF